MPAHPALSEGIIPKIISSDTLVGGNECNAVLQICNIKGIEGSVSRFRVSLNDGKFCYNTCMLATQLNESIKSGKIAENCVIRLKRYAVNRVKDGKTGNEKVIIIIADIEVLKPGDEVKEIIGSPQIFNASGGPAISNNSTNATNFQQNEEENKPKINFPVAKAPPQSRLMSDAPIRSEPAPQRPAPQKSNSIPSASAGGGNRQADFTGVRMCPIAGLTPYQGRWMIRARCTNKSAIKSFQNPRGDGTLFSVDLTDESGEIRATGFSRECDRLYHVFEPGYVYKISRGTIKPAKRQYSTINNDYELQFTQDSIVEPCSDADIDSVPSVQFNFQRLSSLPQMLSSVGTQGVVDVIGVCTQVGDLQEITTKRGDQAKKRDIQLVDDTNLSVRLTLWGDKAESFPGKDFPVVAIKGAKLSEFGGVSLSTMASAVIQVNPDIPDAHRLRGWYDEKGQQIATQSLSNGQLAGAGGAGGAGAWTHLGLAVAEKLGHGDKPDYFSVVATIMQFKKDNALYQACPQEGCKKKVIPDASGSRYRCEKCNREFDNFKYNLILQMAIADITDLQWVTCFSEAAETILEMKVDELGRLKDEDEEQFNQVFGKKLYTSWTFRLRSKLENFNDEMRMKTSITNVTPLNLPEYASRLVKEIEKLD